MSKRTIETFCTTCGANVLLAYFHSAAGAAVAAADPCELTEGGTVYRACPACGDEVVHRPADGANTIAAA